MLKAVNVIKACWIFGAISFIIGLVSGSVILIICGLFIFVFGFIMNKWVKDETTVSEIYDPSSYTLIVNQRSADIGNKVIINEAKYFGRTPVKLHYGSVSVGGVTSGGLYTTGGDLQINNSLHSGKYELDYQFSEFSKECSQIEKIKLTPALFEEAKKSNITAFLNDNEKTIQVIKTSEQILKAGLVNAQEIQAAGWNTESVAAQNLNLKRYPTHEECQAILNWLTHP